MSNTTHFNLTKPVNQSSNWGDDVNENFDIIDLILKNNQDKSLSNEQALADKASISSLNTKAPINHSHDESSLAIQAAIPFGSIEHMFEAMLGNTSPELPISSLYDLKMHLDNQSNRHTTEQIDHEGNLLSTKINDILNLLDYVQVDMSGVTLSADVINVSGGIRISCFADSPVPIQSWKVTISVGIREFYFATSSNSVFFVSDMNSYSIVDSGDIVDIKVYAFSGQSSTSITIAHTYTYVQQPIDLRVSQLESALSPQAIIDRLVQDDNAITSISNILQHSNTLVRKLQEVMEKR